MKGIPQGRYTKEFREETVKMALDGGISLPEAARRLSLPPSTLGNWVRAHKAGKLGDIGKTQSFREGWHCLWQAYVSRSSVVKK